MPVPERYPRFQYALVEGKRQKRIIRVAADEEPEVWKDSPSEIVVDIAWKFAVPAPAPALRVGDIFSMKSVMQVNPPGPRELQEASFAERPAAETAAPPAEAEAKPAPANPLLRPKHRGGRPNRK